MKTKTKLSILAVAALIAIAVGCSQFSNNVFRAEQSLTGVAYTAYVGYTNGLASGAIHITPDQSNSVKVARLQFAASISTLESWRSAYETNSALQPQVQAALDALAQNSSNFVYLIKLFSIP